MDTHYFLKIKKDNLNKMKTQINKWIDEYKKIQKERGKEK